MRITVYYNCQPLNSGVGLLDKDDDITKDKQKEKKTNKNGLDFV